MRADSLSSGGRQEGGSPFVSLFFFRDSPIPKAEWPRDGGS